jgi:hypothetical protein
VAFLPKNTKQTKNRRIKKLEGLNLEGTNKNFAELPR